MSRAKEEYLKAMHTCWSNATQDCDGASISPSHLFALRSQILHWRSCKGSQHALQKSWPAVILLASPPVSCCTMHATRMRESPVLPTGTCRSSATGTGP